jgi:hypothetical protein
MSKKIRFWNSKKKLEIQIENHVVAFSLYLVAWVVAQSVLPWLVQWASRKFSPFSSVLFISLAYFYILVAYLPHERTVESRKHRNTFPRLRNIDEAVFSPCRAEPSRAEPISAVPWRVAHHFTSSSIASHRLVSPRHFCCQTTSISTGMTQRGEGSRDRVSSDVTPFNIEAIIEAPLKGAFPACQIKCL